jgi:hypothetical protein
MFFFPSSPRIRARLNLVGAGLLPKGNKRDGTKCILMAHLGRSTQLHQRGAREELTIHENDEKNF